MSKCRLDDKIIDVILYFILAIIGFITLYPFINVLAVSFNDSTDTIAGGIYLFPRKFTLENYRQVLEYPNLVRAFINSTARTIIGTILSVVCTSMVAFAVSRKDFVLNRFVSIIFLIPMYVSGGLIPSFLLMRSLGLINNFLVYLLPYLISSFWIFVVKSYIDGLPASLQESAMIDGANDILIFFKIIFPLCLPVCATLALSVSVLHWNSWFDTYIYCPNRKELTTLQFELQKIINNTKSIARGGFLDYDSAKQSVYVSPTSIQMAITVVVTIPIILVYPFVQKYFITGMTLGAVKS